MFTADYLNITDPVFTFDRFMEGIDLHQYLKHIPVHDTGRLRYNPVNMLKTILFGFMSEGYISLRKLEDNCKVNLRFMYLMDHEAPSYRTFGYFINEVLKDSMEKIFYEINHKIFRRNRLISVICILMVPNLKPMPTNINGSGKKRLKKPGTVCIKKSQTYWRKSTRDLPGEVCGSKSMRNMSQSIWK